MQIVLEDGALVVRLSMLEKVLAVRFTDIRVPRAQVLGAEPGLPPPTWKQLRLPGTSLPGVIKAGSYLTDRGWEFWYLSGDGRRHPVTISLESHRYSRLVLGSREDGEADRITAWIAHLSGHLSR